MTLILNRIDSCLAISATAGIAEQVGRAHLGRLSFFIPYPCLSSAVASFSLKGGFAGGGGLKEGFTTTLRLYRSFRPLARRPSRLGLKMRAASQFVVSPAGAPC
jgi:hypothetical protein